MHQALAESLQKAGYLADEAITTTLWLAGELQRPLLIEGDAGILSLSIERPGLHDACVSIAGEAAARALEESAQEAAEKAAEQANAKKGRR